MERMHFALMSGAGNLFAVVDAFDDAPPQHPEEIARALSAPRNAGGISPRPDGLLLLLRPTSGGDCRMVLYNNDGSRPETCGNGLRCIAKLAHDRGHVAQARFTIETDAGPCATEVHLENGLVTRARVHMGTPRMVARDQALAAASRDQAPAVASARSSPAPATVFATLVDMGNPHCVLVVDDERAAPVTTLGPLLERHAHFAHGTNVEFLALRDGGAHLRVWERGVGETQACGSGACAAAFAMVARELATWPVRLELPGGTLEVESDGRGGVLLSGPVEILRSGEWHPAATSQRR
jgi:diaminopimelate epimerase